MAQLPAFGGKLRSGIAQQCGHRAPEVSPCEKGTNSGLRLAASDPGSALTVPGSGAAKQSGPKGDAAAPVKKSAALLGKLCVVRPAECSIGPEAVAVVSKNACSYSIGYETEAGLKRCARRHRASGTRASLFSPDLPKTGSSPGRFVYETLCGKWVAAEYRAQPYRFSEGAPSLFPFRGSLSDWFVYQSAARASSLLSLPVTIWLIPTASHANEVMMT